MVKPARYRRKNRGALFPLKLASGLEHALLASLPYIISLLAVGAFFGGVAAYAVNSPAFQLEEVRVLNIGTLAPGQAFKFCELNPGENLITLDLVNVQQVVKRKHPEFKEVRVRRVLPNRIEVSVRRRTPVAQAAFARFAQIDKDLVILPGSGVAPFRNLPVIEGLRPPRGGPVVGASLTDPSAEKAVWLLQEIRRSGVLGKQHAVTKVDIGDSKNVSFYVDRDIEVKIGAGQFVERLKLLKQTLKTSRLDPQKVRYIDLRFDDVVIGT